jgi:CDP-paratose 2-epimerase
MRILITGACGFVGSSVIAALQAMEVADLEIIAFDNLWRPGSELNRERLRREGLNVIHGDVRMPSDLDGLPSCDWVIDAAANASVVAGVDGRTSSRQLIEHNLIGTINLLEFCRRQNAGIVVLSTSRVYSIPALASLPIEAVDGAFRVRDESVPGAGPAGLREEFSTAAPISLYGATKLASEQLALEYGSTFGFPVWVNRCGVLAGAGQFGHPTQGIFAYWVNAFLRRRPLRYIGFGGTGHQVRDCLHPRDLAALLWQQMTATPPTGVERVQNVSGGAASAMSLAQLSAWCADRFGPHAVGIDSVDRPFDIPWLVLDAERAARQWTWRPTIPVLDVLTEIASHAEQHPNWLELSRA